MATVILRNFVILWSLCVLLLSHIKGLPKSLKIFTMERSFPSQYFFDVNQLYSINEPFQMIIRNRLTGSWRPKILN